MPHLDFLPLACWRRAVRLLAPLALPVAVLAIACTDRMPTAPDVTSGTDSLPAGGGPSFVVIPTEDAPETISGTLGVGPNGEAAHPMKVIGQLPKGGFNVIYEATASGVLTGTWVGNGSYTGTITPIGPTGILQGYTCVGVLQVNGSGFTGVSGGCGTAPIPKQYTFRDSVWLSRLQGPGAACNAPAYTCIDYSGSQSVNLTRLSGTVELTSSAPGAVRWGTTVYFTVTRQPANLPMYVLGWKWIPDASSIPPKTSGCVGGTGWSCSAWMKESGTMEVTVFLNGKREVATKRVEVVRRKLQLDVAPGLKVKRGTKLTWTSKTDTAGGSRLSPTWAASDSSAYTLSTCGPNAWTCTEYAQKSYNRYHTALIDDSVQTVSKQVWAVQKFEVRADQASPKLGDTVRFKAFLDDSVAQIPRWRWSGDSTDAADCAGDSTCARVMIAAGTHTMTGYLSDGSAASAQVVVPAPALMLQASKTTALAGEIVTFQLLTDGAISPADAWQFIPDTGSHHAEACAAGTAECEKVMRVSGTMTAFRTIGGTLYSASRHVTVADGCSAIASDPTSGGMLMSLVGEPCGGGGGGGSGGGGDSTGTLHRLTVIRSGDVVHDPSSNVKLPTGTDTIAVFAYPYSGVLGYDFRPGPGYFDVLVTVDDSVQVGPHGYITLDRDRVVTVSARPQYPNRPRATHYWQAYVDLLLSEQKVEAYRNLLHQIAVDAASVSTTAEDLDLAAQMLFDPAEPHPFLPTEDLVDSLMSLESALAGWGFDVEESPSGIAVSATPPDTVPPVVAVAAAPSVTSLPTVVSVVQAAKPSVRFVNGILNGTKSVVLATGELRAQLASRGLGVDTIGVGHIVNPWIGEQWGEMQDARRRECAVRTASLPRTMSVRYRRAAESRCRAYTQWNLGAVVLAITENDLVEAMRQYVSVKTRSWTNVPLVSKVVANTMHKDIVAGQHGIWVAHSQGNMVIAQSIGLLKEREPLLQQTTCTGVVGLASPINVVDYGIDANFVLSYTTKFDVLRFFLPHTDAQVIPTEKTSMLEAKQSSGFAVDLHDRFDAHAFVPNYLRDDAGVTNVRYAVGELLARCGAIQ